ncbi:class 1 fructose-bisphosphatase [Rhizosphaericola mali]|jgi:fructose-1,6-bisphosphatase I|uniref:Fructose-1,6-bisphosphatase class 1 n=1 Tax=Rhizosphaericola mali TaxID=2545455 RepID=A0A5P2G3T3_9BACT|nr:class 1 fructose-bisphosphatase [Rhizosphaericola mali]QES90476.1 class 1 fructose-bisphosphatase [Rhizosphaericola mali]
MIAFKTLYQFIAENQADFPYAKGDLSRLLRDLALAGKIISREVNKAGITDILGEAGSENVQGESQKKLDIYANEQFMSTLLGSGDVCVIVSEENEEPVFLNDERSRDAKYIIAMDPLDGSSNIDVNSAVGTIFSIFRRQKDDAAPTLDEILQEGRNQVAAGYIIYGSSTMLVYTTGNGVNGFTLDPTIGEFCLSHPNMKIPEDGTIYSVNEGNYIYFPRGVKDYIKYCQVYDPNTKRPYNSRYAGSMIAEIHRSMLKGGIYMYPASWDHKEGKIRLMYECNPLAFIIEQANGKASTGKERILDMKPTGIHQRIPVMIGSKNMVEKAEELIRLAEEKERALNN